ncbi:MAG: hypothetical protein OXE59_05410 [Bacteroidetes bacterium]|nr:hypothetical protein [Bacteroidota bacterium]
MLNDSTLRLIWQTFFTIGLSDIIDYLKVQPDDDVLIQNMTLRNASYNLLNRSI